MSARNGGNEPALADHLAAWPVQLRAGRMFGIRAWWSITANVAELSRREAHRVQPLKRIDVTAALLSLPLDLPVPENSLRANELRALSAVPSPLVERIDGAVVRRTSPPVSVDHVVLPTRDFRRGLEAVTQFSTYCARSLVLPAAIDMSKIQLAEASFYGVGIYRAAVDSLAELVVPEPLPPWPETPASWVFAETLCVRLSLLTSLGTSPHERVQAGNCAHALNAGRGRSGAARLSSCDKK